MKATALGIVIFLFGVGIIYGLAFALGFIIPDTVFHAGPEPKELTRTAHLGYSVFWSFLFFIVLAFGGGIIFFCKMLGENASPILTKILNRITD